MPKRSDVVARHEAIDALATPEQKPTLPSPYVAHAGGVFAGKVYTNSVEALESSYQKGYRIAEVDISRSYDGHLVLIHDWDATPGSLYGLPPGQYTLESMRQASAYTPYHFADMDDLARWARAHRDTKIILDTKIHTVEALDEVARRYPDLRDVYVPYIYDFTDYKKVKEMGYQEISLLTRPGQYTPAKLLKFAKTHMLHSIAMMPETLAIQSRELGKYAPIYCWTLNERSSEGAVQDNYGHGIITDTLAPTEMFRRQ